MHVRSAARVKSKKLKLIFCGIITPVAVDIQKVSEFPTIYEGDLFFKQKLQCG